MLCSRAANFQSYDHKVVWLANDAWVQFLTRQPRHCYLHWTRVAPTKTRISHIKRGTSVRHDWRWHFVSEHVTEQSDAGDTYVHKFYLDNWAVNERRWWVMRCTHQGQEACNTSAIYTAKYVPAPGPPPPPIIQPPVLLPGVWEKPFAGHRYTFYPAPHFLAVVFNASTVAVFKITDTSVTRLDQANEYPPTHGTYRRLDARMSSDALRLYIVVGSKNASDNAARYELLTFNVAAEEWIQRETILDSPRGDCECAISLDNNNLIHVLMSHTPAALYQRPYHRMRDNGTWSSLFAVGDGIYPHGTFSITHCPTTNNLMCTWFQYVNNRQRRRTAAGLWSSITSIAGCGGSHLSGCVASDPATFKYVIPATVNFLAINSGDPLSLIECLDVATANTQASIVAHTHDTYPLTLVFAGDRGYLRSKHKNVNGEWEATVRQTLFNTDGFAANIHTYDTISAIMRQRGTTDTYFLSFQEPT